MQRLTLISHEICPFVQRAAIVLAEKGVPFERVDIDLTNKPAWFLALSPLGKVPLLKVEDERGEAVLFESIPICEYLDETQGDQRLHPADPLERARHRAWFEVAGGLFGDVWRMMIAQDRAAFTAARDEVEKKLLLVEAALSPGPYFRDADFSLVDAAFAPGLRNLDVIDAHLDTHVSDRAPRVAAWRRSLAERPSVRAAVRPDYADALARLFTAKGSHVVRHAASA